MLKALLIGKAHHIVVDQEVGGTPQLIDHF